MAENAFIRIGTALLKHQVKKLVGEEALGVIGEELTVIGGDKLDEWLNENSTIEELTTAAQNAQDCFHNTVGDHELQQWMVSLPIGDLPRVLEALEKLSTSPDEKQLDDAIRDSVAGWGKVSPEKIDKAVNSFMSCLRSALLPIEKQTLMVIGRSVLRIEERVNQLAKLVEQLKPYSDETGFESRFGNMTVGGNVDGNFVVGNSNVVTNVTNNYYQQVVEKNIEKHEPDYWALKHPYPMPPNFTGRIAERALLTHWLKEDSENRLFILRALGGFGKSALSWQWLTYDVDPKEFPKVIFWSFYEGDASFEHFIEETLKYLKLKVPQGQREQVDELLQAMGSQKILLIMDGFERLLRAYGNMNASHQGDEDKKLKDTDRDCVNLNMEHFLKGICSMPNMKSKALMTTRLTPRALEKYGQFIQGCREEELRAMHKDDAIAFFRAQGVRKGTNHEIEVVCRLYGFHPLSLRLLAGHIITSLKNAGDIVVAQKLQVSGDVLEHQNHILEVSFNRLPPHQQKLLSTMACFRSSTKLDTLEAVAENKDTLEENLQDLMERGLVQFDRKNAIFDLHPIVRRFAYDRLTTPQRTDAHIVLVVYFEAVPQPQKIEKLEDLTPIIELYHHMVRAGKLDEARVLYRDRLDPLYYQFGAYQLIVELMQVLFVDGEDKLPRLKDESAQAWTLNELANSYSLSGQPRRAVPLYEMNIVILEKIADKSNTAIALGNVASVAQLPIGALSAAERNLRRAIDLSQEIGNEKNVGSWQYFLSQVLVYCGGWDDSEELLRLAEEIKKKTNHLQAQSVIWSYRALRFLLLVRGNPKSKIRNLKSAIESAQRALELADEAAKPNSGFVYPILDYVSVYWLLGAAYRMNNDLNKAEENLSKALNLCRQINNVESEANILIDFARLRYDQKKYEEAKSLADEDLLITERCGYVLQGADVNLFLAQYALEQEKDKAKAKEYAETALKLAYCDGPPHYYKVAYDEAVAMLEGLR